MISPFKAVIGDSYNGGGAALLAPMHLRLACRRPAREIERMIKTSDRAAAYLEATRLAGFDPAESAVSSAARPLVGPRWNATISRRAAETAQARYHDRFTTLASK